MPAHPPTPPAGHAEALLAWVRRLCEQVGEAPRAMPALPVYALGRDDLAAGRGLEAAILGTWCTLLLDAAGTLRALELAPPPPGAAAWRLGGLYVGERVQATHRALAAAVAQDGEAELRLLRCAQPPFEAAWLHAGGHERLVPAARTGPGIEAGGCYAAEPLLALLRPAAQRRGAQPAPDEAP
jgi:hypothetical protein